MQIATIGIDLTKNVFQVHGANEHGKPVLRKQLNRDQVVVFFSTCRRVSSAWRRAAEHIT